MLRWPEKAAGYPDANQPSLEDGTCFFGIGEDLATKSFPDRHYYYMI
jgi:hypothetical protein